MSEQETDLRLCKGCQKNTSDPLYTYPFCQECRHLLANRPFPSWIKFVMVVVCAMMVYSAIKIPATITAGKAQRSARTSESCADYQTAILQYQKILSIFPNSEEHKARLAICYFKSGDIVEAGKIVRHLNEKSLSKSVIAELNAAIENLQKKPVSN